MGKVKSWINVTSRSTYYQKLMIFSKKEKEKKKLYVETRYLQTKFTNPHIYLWTKGIYSMSFEFERERERESERVGVFYFQI